MKHGIVSMLIKCVTFPFVYCNVSLSGLRETTLGLPGEKWEK